MVMLKRHHLVMATGLSGLLAGSALAGDDKSAVNPLGEYRLLVMCLDETADVNPAKTLPIYESVNWEAFKERDLLFVEVRSNSVYTVLGRPQTEQAIADDVTVWDRIEQDNENNPIRKTAACRNDMDFILIGKDTGVKARWEKTVPFDALFSKIDSMPMRRMEMRRQSGEY